MQRRPTITKVIQRLAVGHFLAYPIAFLVAVASIPLTIHFHIRAIDALNDDMPAIGQLVIRKLLVPVVASAILAHIAAVPWAASGDSPHGLRRFLWLEGTLAAFATLGGLGSWLWLLLR